MASLCGDSNIDTYHMTSPVFFLLGPTACGKTAMALMLAEILPIEIVSVDSALVYQDMNIGTAKPSQEELAICPHHLINLISPEQSYSVAQFCQDATRAIKEIKSRQHIPLLVGGTMMYYKALKEGISELPQADKALREEIEQQAEQHGWLFMHKKLAQLDPLSAAKLAPTDSQRIQRALEINYLSGKTLAENFSKSTKQADENYVSLSLYPEQRSQLHQLIAERFHYMLNQGFIEELQSLRQHYQLNLSLPSMRCVGYRQVWEYLDGLIDKVQLIEKGIAATRQLAKRQITWQRQFQSQWQDYHQFNCFDENLAELIKDCIKKHLRK